MSDPLINTSDGTADTPAVAIANLSSALTPQLDGMRADYFATDKEKRLILGRALVLARQIETDLEMRSDLDDACERQGIRCHIETEVINRVLRYVTGDKQVRSNSYASSLKAIPDHINTAEKIAAYIEAQGGLEKLRAFYAACQKAASQTQPDERPSSPQPDNTAMDELVQASHPGTGPTLPGGGDDGQPAKVTDLPKVPGGNLQPNLADGQIEPTKAPRDDAGEQLSPPCQGPTDIRRYSIARSTITPDKVAKGDIVMIAYDGHPDLTCVVNYPGLVEATGKFVMDFMNRHPAKDGDAAIDSLVASAARTGGK